MKYYISTSSVIGENSILKFKVNLSDYTLIFNKYIEGKYVLDIGCVDMIDSIDNYHKFIKSEDFLHAIIANKAHKVLGVDINEVGVKILNENGFNILVLNLMNDQDINLISHISFDTIILHHVIEHLPNP